MTQNPTSRHSLTDSERLQERLITEGAASLSPAELLALVLHTGNTGEEALDLAVRIIERFGDLHSLTHASWEDVAAIKGLGSAKTAQVAAAIEIARRVTGYHPDQRPIISNAGEAARLMIDMASLQQEHVRVILLDLARRVIAIPTVYIGTLTASVLRTSEIYREAVIRNAPALVLVHNHPSGDPSPSPEDLELTRTLCAAGKLLDIALVDHLIISPHGWTSLKELGFDFC